MSTDRENRVQAETVRHKDSTDNMAETNWTDWLELIVGEMQPGKQVTGLGAEQEQELSSNSWGVGEEWHILNNRVG